jgi:hypothetical protein
VAAGSLVAAVPVVVSVVPAIPAPVAVGDELDRPLLPGSVETASRSETRGSSLFSSEEE